MKNPTEFFENRSFCMRFFIKIFMYFSLLGFIASLMIHLYSYVDADNPFGINPWPLHIGIFLVWVPAVFLVGRLSKEAPNRYMWRFAFRGCKQWMVIFFYCLLGYIALNFFVSLNVSNKGVVNTVRVFSGHWMFFYYTAFSIMYSYLHIDEFRGRAVL